MSTKLALFRLLFKSQLEHMAEWDEGLRLYHRKLRQERQRQERKGEMPLRELWDGLAMNVQEARQLSGMVNPRPLNSALRRERQKRQEREGVRVALQQTRKHKAGSRPDCC